MKDVPERGIITGCETGIIGSLIEERGGKWVHLDRDFDLIKASRNILKGGLIKADESRLPFKDEVFDIAVIPDFLEHIKCDMEFLREIRRTIKTKGTCLITVPHYKKNSILRRIKNLIGMKDELYGHVRSGYTIEELKILIENSGFEMEKIEFYSGTFSEIAELILNIGFVLTGKKKEGFKGVISPMREEDIASRKILFRIHGIIYPFLKALSFFDKLLFLQKGYVIALRAKKI